MGSTISLRIVFAGFPSPAEDHLDQPLDLNEFLISNKPSTFFTQVEGDSMEGEGIFSGDIAIVDKSIEAVSGDIIIAIYNGGFLIKRLRKESTKIWLDSAHPNHPPIEITESDQFQIWGVVTNSIRRIRKVF